MLVAIASVVHNVVPAITRPIRRAAAAVGGGIDISTVAVRIAPPAYTRLDATVVRDPLRVDALAGSTITFTVETNADTLRVATRDSSRTMVRNAGGVFSFTVPSDADGFVALSPSARDGRSGTRRLIGVTIRTDAAPRVRIVAPARDLILEDARRTLQVGIEADDDLALGTLRLRYTKVSGSGERFTFSEGEVPVNIARTKPTEWTARAALALEPLLQEPGDLVVYRAVASDRRPGAPPAESDAFIAELAAAGGVAALGFSMDPDEDRYALSQQMVILKTERLIAQRGSLTPEALAEQSMQLAGEQRRVRAEFVFMMGGEFAQQATGEDGMMELDEHEEAESEGDLAAGRMVNRGRTALLAAVRAMSRAAVALTTAELTPALSQEKVALTQLQEAFARNRFLMRALSQREQLDVTRRLSGSLEGVTSSRARVPEGETNARVLALQAVLSELTAAGAPAVAGARRESHVFVSLAERLLQIDASSAATQRIAAQLTAADAATSATARRVLRDSAVVGLTDVLRRDMRPAAAAPIPADARRLQAALDATRDATRDAARGAERRPAPRPIDPPEERR